MSTAGQKFMTELSTRSINAAAPSSSGSAVAWRWRTLPKFSEGAADQEWSLSSTEPNFINAHHHEVEPLYVTAAQRPMDLHGAASFVDELIGEDCDDSVRALVRKTILSAAQCARCAVADTWGVPDYPRACVNCGKIAPASVSRGAYLCKEDHPDQDMYACTIDMTYDEAMDEIKRLGGRIADRIRDIEALEDRISALPSTTRATGPLVLWELDCQRAVCAAPECECPALASTNHSGET